MQAGVIGPEASALCCVRTVSASRAGQAITRARPRPARPQVSSMNCFLWPPLAADKLTCVIWGLQLAAVHCTLAIFVICTVMILCTGALSAKLWLLITVQKRIEFNGE